MKRINRIFLLLCCALTTSCGDWLDVKPQDTATEKNLFESFSGFRSALNGIYQQLASKDLYGKELTWGYLSALGQYYDNTNVQYEFPYKYTALYEYKNSEVLTYGERIWSTGYNTIANCNNLLKNIEDFPASNFPQSHVGEKELIQGEALAVRALVHFDLLRLFAPSYAASATARAIPYSTVYPDRIPTYKTVSQVIEMVIADLEKAYTLVSIYDLGHFDRAPDQRISSSTNSPEPFFGYRGTHMNMVAVKALLARVNLYKGDFDKAFELANELYTTYKDTHSFTPAPAITAGEATRERKLYHDLILSFHNRLLIKDYSEFYKQSIIPTQPITLVLEARNVDYMYTSYRVDNDDMRFSRLLIKPDGGSKYTSLKYLESTNSNMNEVQGRVLPVIRMSEVYYILAECYARQSNMTEALKMLKTVRIGRGAINRNAQITEAITFDEFMEELEYDVWKENLGEGQFFFFCKRLNKPTMRNGQQQIDMTGKWVMDIPQSETSLL